MKKQELGPQYSNSFSDDLKNHRIRFTNGKDNHSRIKYDLFNGLLQHGEHFLVSDSAQLSGWVDKDDTLTGLNFPFPVTILEYESSFNVYEVENLKSSTASYINIIIDAESQYAEFLDADTKNDLPTDVKNYVVLCAWKDQESPIWFVNSIGYVISASTTVNSAIHSFVLTGDSGVENISHMSGQMNLTFQELRTQLVSASAEEVRKCVNFGLLCSCSNIEKELIIKPINSSLKAQQRKRKGLAPLNSYWSLFVDVSKTKQKQTVPHTEPSYHMRSHKRRGHVRHLEHKNTWVSSCYIGAKNNCGTVDKMYVI